MDLSRKAILETIFKCMEEDPTIYLIGEGARLKASFDYPPLLERFGDRVLTTPICEAGLVNMGLGASVTGMRPIVDLIANDFMLRAMEEILNEVAKIHVLSGGRLHSKMVIKTELTKYENAQAGNDYGYLFERIPPPLEKFGSELRVRAPKTVEESSQMMYDALHYSGPTVFFENRMMQALL